MDHQPGRQGNPAAGQGLGAGAGPGSRRVAGVECVFLTGGVGTAADGGFRSDHHRSHFDWLVGRGLLRMFLSASLLVHVRDGHLGGQSWPRLQPPIAMLLQNGDHNLGIARGTMPTNRSSASWRRPWLAYSPPTTSRCRSCRQSPHLQLRGGGGSGGGGGGHSLGDGHSRCRN